MENTSIKMKKEISPVMAGVMSLGFAILSIIFHGSVNAILAVIVGVFGIVKGDKLGKILSVAGIILGIISFILFNPFKAPFQTTDGSVYSNTKYNFQITPPTGWAINENLKDGAIVAFVNLTAQSSDYPIITINLLLGDNLSLDDYINNGVIESQNLPNFHLISNEKFGSGDGSYYITESVISDINKLSGGKIGNIGSSMHNLMLTREGEDGKFFIVAGGSDDAAWSKYSTDIRNSLLSFTYPSEKIKN